jgi:sorting nexin-8
VNAGDASVPNIYSQAFGAVDPSNSGETSVNSLSRVLGTSGLSASTIDKVNMLCCGYLRFLVSMQHVPQIVSLVSSKPRVSKLEFFVALALVGLAQSGKGVCA